MSDDLDMIPLSARPYVLHADHLASHKFDVDKERALFESALPWNRLERSRDGQYARHWIESEWQGWIRCAKSRAKAAGCSEC